MTQLNVSISDLLASARDDEEALFSRDVDGQLIRLDAPTQQDYGIKATLHIDGRRITVPVARPLTDAQGNIVQDLDGNTTPRYTTIHDAALELYGEAAKVPIPTLCHQAHMKPVAVCRLCSVLVGQELKPDAKARDADVGKKQLKLERRFTPACQRGVKDQMHVFTMSAEAQGDYLQTLADADRVVRMVGDLKRSVTVLTELLTADHLKAAPAPAPAELAEFNELRELAGRYGAGAARFALPVLSTPARPGPGCDPHAAAQPLDQSSPVFIVDRSACILCDRCSRACDDVKNNRVIGRTGKGYFAGIGFDLNDIMGESSCVQCGECMVSCPTSAITFRPVARVQLTPGAHGGAAATHAAAGAGELLTARELIADDFFRGVPPKFLLWQEGLAIRRRITAGAVLCRQGEPGNTAFIIRKGRFEIISKLGAAAKRGGLLSWIRPEAAAAQTVKRFECGLDSRVMGEMACLSGTPRTAQIVALEDGEVWEIRRNVLDRIMRSPNQRRWFEDAYRARAMDLMLEQSDMFNCLPEAQRARCIDFLRPRVKFVRVNPGQKIFEQGDWADALYLVRLGHVRVALMDFDREVGVVTRMPGSIIGEIGLLALSGDDAGKSAEDVDRQLAQALEAGGAAGLGASIAAGRRTATCAALDHLEMAQISRQDFLLMVRQFPVLRRRLVDVALARLREDAQRRGADAHLGTLQTQYTDQGLYQGRSLLVLDLDSCTRCDECTRACVDQHGTESHGAPISRLKRDGLRFDKFLVASSCRSCNDAYCMIGCPVDAIHRGKHLQIVIENHCIGCGLCERNCPYGNIWMPQDHHTAGEADGHAGGTQKARFKAAACDLCDADGQADQPQPRCVSACPHDAAHRMRGEDLLQLVQQKQRH